MANYFATACVAQCELQRMSPIRATVYSEPKEPLLRPIYPLVSTFNFLVSFQYSELLLPGGGASSDSYTYLRL